MKLIFSDNGMRALLNFRIDVIRHFAARGDEVILIYPQCTHETERECDIPAGCRTIALPVNPTGRSIAEDIRYFRSLKRIYKSERPDAIVHYSIKPNIYGTLAARSYGIRSIAMVAGLGYAFTGNQPGKIMARTMLRFALRRSDAVLTLNSHIVEVLSGGQYVRKGKIIFLEGGEGVNLERYAFSKKDFEQVRFLMVARLLLDKGYREFVSAADMVRKEFHDARFDILGPLDEDSPMGVSRAELDADISSGKITYLGYMTDPRAELSDPDTVIVLPSYYPEGMSRSLMEAASTGCPIIASDIPGCRELVQEDSNGYLCTATDAESIAEAMKRFLLLPRERKQDMGRQSRKLAEERFDVQKVIEVYESLIGK